MIEQIIKEFFGVFPLLFFLPTMLFIGLVIDYFELKNKKEQIK